jgi:O-antigen/teichoic acid export membrane protein
MFETLNWLKSTSLLSVVLGMQVVGAQAGVILLGFLSTTDQVGIYRVTVQGAGLVAFTLNAVGIAIAPHISRLYHSGDIAQLQRMITLAARLVLAIGLPTSLALLCFGEPILRMVFGEAYAAGHVALGILAIGQLVHVGVGSAGFILNMTGNEKHTAIAVTLGAALNILLNILLIPSFGIEGAAMATATTYFITSIFLWRSVRTRLNLESTAWGARTRPS